MSVFRHGDDFMVWGTRTQQKEFKRHGNKRHDCCHRRNLLKNSPIQRTEAAFQCKVV